MQIFYKCHCMKNEAEVWTPDRRDDQDVVDWVENTIGRVTKQFSVFAPRYEILISDGHCGRARVHGLITDLLNATWRA